MDRLTETTLERQNDRDFVPTVDEQPGNGQPTGEPQLLIYARTLWLKRALLVKATLAGFFVATIIAVLIPRSFQASVQLMPPDSSTLSGSSPGMLGLAMGIGAPGLSSSSGGGGGLPASGLVGAVGDLLGSQRPGSLLIGVLGSRTLCDRMIDRFDLRKVYDKKLYSGARKELLSRVTFKEDKKSGIISIIVSDHDRARSWEMAKAYVEELNVLLSHVNNSASSREREFLEHRLGSVNTELQVAAKDLSEFSSHNATLDPEDQGKAMLDAAAQLQAQLIAAKSELSGLQQIYTNENVRVRSLQAHIGELEQQVNDLGGKNYAGSTKLDANALYPSLRQLPVLDQQYAELYRRAKVDEIVFELLTEAYEMAKVEEAKDTPSVRVLDAPRLPERPNWPPRALIALGGGFLGFLIASFMVVRADSWANDPYRLFLAEISRGVVDDWRGFRCRLTKLVSRNGNSRN